MLVSFMLQDRVLILPFGRCKERSKERGSERLTTCRLFCSICLSELVVNCFNLYVELYEAAQGNVINLY